MHTGVHIIEQLGHRFLWIDGYLWMWDIPVERKAQKELADHASGNVLVAGYGLGLVQEYLLKNPKVTWVTTVEQNPKVIEVVRDTYNTLYGDVIIQDFFNLEPSKKYDCIIGDVWEDIVAESLPEYIQFKKKAEQLLLPSGTILAWGKDFFEYLLATDTQLKKFDKSPKYSTLYLP